MSEEIKEIQQMRSESTRFYDNKIKEVRALGSKISHFTPSEQLSKISQKLNLSSQTASLLKKVSHSKSK